MHAGIADAKTKSQLPFSPRSCQILAILDIAFETQLSELCSDILRGLEYNGPLRTVFTSPDSHFDLAEAISSIRSTTDLENFCQVIGGPKDPRDHDINFENLRDYARYGTIEYRKHAGSSDAEAIVNRVKLVVALTSWAVNGNNLEHLLWANEKKHFGEELDILKLMRLVGVEEGVVAYYSRRLFPIETGKSDDASCAL